MAPSILSYLLQLQAAASRHLAPDLFTGGSFLIGMFCYHFAVASSLALPHFFLPCAVGILLEPHSLFLSVTCYAASHRCCCPPDVRKSSIQLYTHQACFVQYSGPVATLMRRPAVCDKAACYCAAPPPFMTKVKAWAGCLLRIPVVLLVHKLNVLPVHQRSKYSTSTFHIGD